MSMSIWWFVLVIAVAVGLGVVWGWALRSETHHCPDFDPPWWVRAEVLRYEEIVQRYGGVHPVQQGMAGDLHDPLADD